VGYLDVAAAEIGYQETPNNITKYWADLNPGFQGQPWCFAFVSWCLSQASNLNAIGGSPLYYCPTGVAMARAAGEWFNEPVAGALVFFNFGGNTAVHIEFVESVSGGGSIVTIGGNTSSGTAGSQSNGGGVYRRYRSSGIMGYWHIDGSAGGGGGFTIGQGVRAGVVGAAPTQTVDGERAADPSVRFVYAR
jgi:hypothetical protein